MQSLRSLPRFATPTARLFSTTTPRALARMQIIGRLADTPEASNTSTGRVLTRFALGVSSGPKDEQGNRAVSWFRVASFLEDGPQRDVLLSLPKGTQVYVDADAKMDTFQGADGQNRTQLNLLMRNFEALSRPQSSRESTPAAEEPMSGAGAA